MDASFGDQYLQHRRHAARWKDRDVFGSIRIAFDRPCTFTIDCSFEASELQQGVVVRLRGRKGRVNDEVGERFVLWEYAPFPVAVTMLARKAPFEIGIWNVWKETRGGTAAWLANAGMLVDSWNGRHVTLHGNAGPNEVTFRDLTITVRWPEEVQADLVLPE